MKISRKQIHMNILVLIIIIFTTLCSACNNDPKAIIAQYGWHTITNDQSSPTISITLDNSYLELDITKMKISASKNIGLDPSNYIDIKVEIVQYVLFERGPTNNLRAEIWLYKGEVICAYLFHAEPNEKLKYWPLNTTLAEIDEFFGNESTSN